LRCQLLLEFLIGKFICNKMEQKTYFPISSVFYNSYNPNVKDKIEIELPSYFKNSKEPRYIVVRNCRIVLNNALVNDIKFHSHIVQENPYDDYFICFTNELMVKPKRYRWNRNNNTIRIWFTDTRNNKILVNDCHIDNQFSNFLNSDDQVSNSLQRKPCRNFSVCP
jgi:hypothetical protein